MKFGRALWSVGSLLTIGTILIVQYLWSLSPATGLVDRCAYIQANWDVFGPTYRIESLLTAMVAGGSFYFATRTREVGWAVVAVAQLLLLCAYPVRFAGFTSSSVEVTTLAHSIATEVTLLGFLCFMAGLIQIYLTAEGLPKWLRFPAVGLAAIAMLGFAAGYFGVLAASQAWLVFPALIVLYLLNSYYGLVVSLSRRGSFRRSSSRSLA